MPQSMDVFTNQRIFQRVEENRRQHGTHQDPESTNVLTYFRNVRKRLQLRPSGINIQSCIFCICETRAYFSRKQTKGSSFNQRDLLIDFCNITHIFVFYLRIYILMWATIRKKSMNEIIRDHLACQICKG